jgi:hypothetical protein
MDAAQRARLRALAEKARDAEAAYRVLPNTAQADDVLRLGRARNNASHALEHAASPDAILALLDALDEAERERDEARTQRDDTALEFDVVWGAALKANTERDALAALLREARSWLDSSALRCENLHHDKADQHEWTGLACPVEARIGALLARIDAALDGAKGAT